MGYHGQGNGTRWLSYGEFITNVENIFEGFLGLLYVLPPHDNIAVMSAEGIKYLPNIVIFCVLLGAVVMDLCIIVKRKLYVDKEILFIACILWGNLAAFSVLDLTYGSSVYELRYLMPCFWMMILMFGYHFSRFEWRRKRVNVIWQVLIVASICLSALWGYQEYITEKNIISSDEEIARQIAETEAELVFFMGEGLNLAGCNVRCFDLDRTYQLINENGRMVQNGGLKIYDDYDGEPIPCVFVGNEKQKTVIANLKENGWDFLKHVEGYLLFEKECTRIYYEERVLQAS